MAKRKAKTSAKRCAWCRVPFAPNRPKQIYCCSAHRLAAHRQRREDAGLSAKFDRIISETYLGLLRDNMRKS